MIQHYQGVVFVFFLVFVIVFAKEEEAASFIKAIRSDHLVVVIVIADMEIFVTYLFVNFNYQSEFQLSVWGMSHT